MSIQRVGWFLCLFSVLALGQEKQEPSAPPAPATAAEPTTKTGADSPEAKPAPLPDLTPDAKGKLSQEQMQQLLRVVADKDDENDKVLRDYTYTEHEVEHDLDGKGQVKSTEVRTYEVMEVYGEQVRRLIEKDDKPLDAKEAAKEEERIQKIMDKRKNESDEDRKKRAEKEEKERQEGREFVHEVADAYIFTLVGTEDVGGREAWVITGEPRPGYEPHMKDAKFLPKFHGKVWIDKKDLQLSRLEVEALETVSFGWVLARIHKGTRVMLEQTRVNDEVWLPRHINFKVDARVALVKGYNLDGEQTFRDYKKFRTSSKIVGMGEVQENAPENQPPNK
jgi:hypothetical protein